MFELANGPDALGQLWEQLLGDAERRSQGSHFTPPHIAARVVSIAFACVDCPEDARVLDPAVGGGAFLLAAARWLEANTNLSRSDIAARLYGADIDVGAAAVADAALELWSGGSRPNIEVIDSILAMPSSWPDTFDVVIGNPPFLSQLASTTTREEDRSAILADRYGHAMGYADEAAVFLRRAVDLIDAGSVTSLLVPQSVLGASAAEPIRKAVSDACHLCDLWVDGEQVFGASVDVVAPVLVHGARGNSTRVHIGMDGSSQSVPTPGSESWAPLLAAAKRIPLVSIGNTTGTLGERASVTAGFRQHFYGIADAVCEDDGSGHPRLLTAGAIDSLDVKWREQPIKFAGTRFASPVVRLDEIDDVAVRSWFESRLVPKVLVATQTRVVEAVGDVSGTFVPSVPVIVVEPHDGTSTEVWRIAAVLTTPLVSALLGGKNAGTGLSSDTIRIRASDVVDLPLPADEQLWDEGAELAEQAQYASSAESRRELLIELATVMTEAYGDTSESFDWWRAKARYPPAR